MIILILIMIIIPIILCRLIEFIFSMLYKIKINNMLENINSIEDLLYVSFKDLLNLVSEVLRRKGYTVKITDKCGDEGYGLILNDIQFVEIYNNALYPAEVEVAMKLAKCMQRNSIYRGMLIALGDTKQSTKLFCHKNVIRCINGEELLEICKEVQNRKGIINKIGTSSTSK